MAYQILPDVWGAAHIYRPDPMPEGKLPAVLYVCGHIAIGTHGFQEHPIMWARKGYVCLIFDTIEQGDNPGDHHGIYDGKRLDWFSLGYTPAGGELWNSMRALDLLLSLPEVDEDRVGATGISGGGAHSLFLAVADERIKTVASVAGTDCVKTLVGHRHVWGHCDCMFPLNLYRRDASEFLALIAPRPLLLCFAREDSLYTPEGWRGMFEKVRKVYELYGEGEKCQLFEYPGPHAYSPEAVRVINDWFDRFVAGERKPKGELRGEERTEPETSVFHGAPTEVDRLDILPQLLARRGRVRLPEGPKDWLGIREEVVRKLVEGPPIVGQGVGREAQSPLEGGLHHRRKEAGCNQGGDREGRGLAGGTPSDGAHGEVGGRACGAERGGEGGALEALRGVLPSRRCGPRAEGDGPYRFEPG